jgi:hypothetical protein
MNGECGMVDRQVSREVGRDGGNNTFPIHKRFIFELPRASLGVDWQS